MKSIYNLQETAAMPRRKLNQDILEKKNYQTEEPKKFVTNFCF